MENNYEIIDEAIIREESHGYSPNTKRSAHIVDQKQLTLEEKHSNFLNKSNLDNNFIDSQTADKILPVSKNILQTKNLLQSRDNKIAEEIQSLMSSLNNGKKNSDTKKMAKTFYKSKTKDNSINKSSNTSRISNTSNLSYGERLYRKSIALKEAKEQTQKEFLVSKEKEFRTEHSFRPKLNKQTFSISLKQVRVKIIHKIYYLE